MARAGLTVERLVQAAAELADEVGFDNLTVSALARRFGVSTTLVRLLFIVFSFVGAVLVAGGRVEELSEGVRLDGLPVEDEGAGGAGAVPLVELELSEQPVDHRPGTGLVGLALVVAASRRQGDRAQHAHQPGAQGPVPRRASPSRAATRAARGWSRNSGLPVFAGCAPAWKRA